MFKGVPVERVLGRLIGGGKEGKIALPHVWQLTPSKTLDSSLCGFYSNVLGPVQGKTRKRTPKRKD
jgi:hypothetical protein